MLLPWPRTGQPGARGALLLAGRHEPGRGFTVTEVALYFDRRALLSAMLRSKSEAQAATASSHLPPRRCPASGAPDNLVQNLVSRLDGQDVKVSKDEAKRALEASDCHFGGAYKALRKV